MKKKSKQTAHQESSFFADVKRLVAIIPYNWPIFWRGVVQYTFWAIYPVFTIVMLGLITQEFESGDYASVLQILYRYAGLSLVIHIINYVCRNLGWVEQYNSYSKILHRIYMPKFVYLDSNHIERIGTGRCISIIEKGFSSRSGFLVDGAIRGISFVLTLGYFVVLLGNMGREYLAVFILAFVLVMGVSYKLNSYVLVARQRRVDGITQYSRALVRIIMSKNEIIQSRDNDYEMERLDGPMDDNIEANKGMNPYFHRMFFGPGIVLDAIRIAFFVFIGLAYFQGDSGISFLVTVGAAFVLLDGVIDDYIKFFKDMTKEFDVVKKLRRLFDEHKPAISYTEGKKFRYQSGDVEIQNISFSYPSPSGGQSEKIFENLTLSLHGKKKTALVGVSGSGKSTLVKLIAGYLKPDSGSVVIDGQDLADVALISYYEHIGYLTQEPSVFDGTILENLSYAAQQGVDEEAIKEALEYANCQFVRDLPDGIHTQIGERGVRLSGGQRQRLAIAKIFLKNPKIIILDEPTSALDSFSEEAITEAMHKLFEGRTVIIIAHRLQTVKESDDIIVLEKGAVVERGTHQQLIDLGGSYATMLRLQSGF